MIFEGFCSGSLESYQLYLSLWLINYCKIELGKAFCYQLYSGPTKAKWVNENRVETLAVTAAFQPCPCHPQKVTPRVSQSLLVSTLPAALSPAEYRAYLMPAV